MSTLNLKIQNNSGIADKDVYIGFWGTILDAMVNGEAMQSIESGSWYKLSEINSFAINSTTSGRIYVAYHDTFSADANGGLPSFTAPNSPAYLKRFDKFELTFDGSTHGVADLTAIDFWSIPMSLSTSLNGQNVGTLQGVKTGSSEKDIYTHLHALSDPTQSSDTAELLINAFKNTGHPLPTGVQDQLTEPASGVVTKPAAATDPDGKPTFVRVIGPNSYPPLGNISTNIPPGLPFTPYNTFYAYFKYLIENFQPDPTAHADMVNLGAKKIAHIAGNFAGSTAGTTAPYQAQSYDLKAYVDDRFNLYLKGTASEVGDILLMVSGLNLLDPAATYGGSPVFSLNRGSEQTPGNDIYGWIFGDFFAGLNIGAIGSTVVVDQKVVGEMTSSEWFSILPSKGKLFDQLWGTGVSNYWNTWAQQLNARSDAYNFAYAERFSAPQLSLNPATVDTLTLTLLNADVSTDTSAMMADQMMS